MELFYNLWHALSSSEYYGQNCVLLIFSVDELKSLLMKVKVESEKVGLKLNI